MNINGIIKDFLVSQREYGVVSVDVVHVFSIVETSKELRYLKSNTEFVRCKKGDYIFVLGFKTVNDTTHDYIKKLNAKFIDLHEVKDLDKLVVHFTCKSV